MRNWIIVYSGNYFGAIGIVLLVFASKQYAVGAKTVGETTLNIFKTEVSFGFVQAVALLFFINNLS